MRLSSSLRRRCRRGFTLIELMIVVAILGILSALAVPAFQTYLRRSYSAEAPLVLASVYASAVAFYNLEQSQQSVLAPAVTYCVVGADRSAWTPDGNKHSFKPTVSVGFDELGVSVEDQVRYNYEIDRAGQPAECGVTSANPAVYTFRAIGDLDNDAVLSTFEMAVGSAVGGGLYRAAGFYVHNELE